MFSEDNNQTYHEQVQTIASALRMTIPSISFELIGYIFGVSRGTIDSQIRSKGWNDNLAEGKAFLLDNEMAAIGQFILGRFEDHNPATYSDVMNFVTTTLEKYLLLDTIGHIIHRLGVFKIIGLISFEENRIDADKYCIDDYFSHLEKLLINYSVALVINVDKSENQDWTDASIQKVNVPSDYTDKKIRVPIRRDTKRATLIESINLLTVLSFILTELSFHFFVCSSHLVVIVIRLKLRNILFIGVIILLEIADIIIDIVDIVLKICYLILAFN
jgi:hypothetical protein